MTEVAQRLLDALSVGATYAVLALGLSLVFSVMNLINFAYGMLLVWAGFTAIVLVDAGLPVPVVVVGVVAFTTGMSVLTGLVAFRPFLGASGVTLLITSFAVELALQSGAIFAFGESPRVLEVPPELTRVATVAGLRVPVIQIVTIVVAVAVLVLLYLVVYRSTFGLRVRAAAERPGVARLMGVNPRRVTVGVFALSGAIAGVVGLLWFAKIGAVSPRDDIGPTLKAFIAVVLGGLGSPKGAVYGGLALGFLEVAMNAALPDDALGYQDALVFAAVIGILLFRPRGIAGARTEVTG